MAQFQTISHINIARGMDTRSALKNIQEGFAEEIRNMDTNSAGFVEKRKGYQSYVGFVPLRVTNVQEDSIEGFSFEFDDSMSFANVTSSPVLGKGKLWWDKDSSDTIRTLDTDGSSIISSDNSEVFTEGQQIKVKVSSVWGDYTVLAGGTTSPLLGTALSDLPYALLEEKELYWDSFTNNIYKSMTSGVAQEFTKGTTDLDILVGTAIQTDANTYELVETDYTTIDTDTVDQTILTVAGTEQIMATYFVDPTATFNSYTRENMPISEELDSIKYEGVIFITTGTAADITFDGIDDVDTVVAQWNLDNGPDVLEYYGQGSAVLSAGTVSMTEKRFRIQQATHNLPNKNLIAQLWEEDTDEADTTVVGTNVKIEPSDFEVGANGDVMIHLQYDAVPDATPEFTVVLYDVPVARTQTNVGSIGIAGTEAPITFTMPITSEFVFAQAYLLTSFGQEQVKLESAFITGADITFTIDIPDGVAYNDVKIVTLEGETGTPSITVGTGGVDDSTPEFCIYGLDPADILFDNKAGHVNTLEEYSAIGQSDIVVGMGGNLFVESTDFVLSSTRVDIRGFTSFTAGTQSVAPLFSSQGVTQIINNGDNTATITFDSAVDLTNASGHYVAVSGASNAAYNGTFVINAATTFATLQTTMIVDIVSSGTYLASTETDTSAIVTLDTFVLEMETGHSFEVGDIITSSQFPDYNPIVRSTATTSLLIGGISGIRSVFSGVTLTGTRTSNIINTPYAVSAFVKGDVLTLSGFTRKFRVLSLDVSDMVHAKLTLDETITVVDSTLGTAVTSVSLDSRWLCVEFPDFNERTVKHFTADYDAQERLQTARINDSIFYTDYTGAVMKYDGNEIYQAGLIPWSPNTHSYVDISTAQEKIVVDNYEATSIGAAAPGGFVDITFDVNTMPPLPENNEIFISGLAQAHSHKAVKITDYIADPTDGYIITVADADITGGAASGTVSIPEKVGYYFKLQAYDRNNNIVASAVTDYRDSLVTILKTGRVYHRLNNLPKFNSYHYDRVDLEVYRTKKAETVVPEFFRIRTIPLEFQEYERAKDLIISDSLGNNTFGDPDDLVSNSISLQTTGTALERPVSYEGPQKSKYITSIANRLVQGNTLGYDSLTLRFDTDSTDVFEGISVVVGSETYKFLASGTSEKTTVSSIDPNADGDSIDFTVADSSAFEVGEWVQITSTATTNTLEKISGPAMGWWKVSSIPDGTSVVVESALGETVTIGAPNYVVEMYSGGAVDTVPIVSFTATEFRPFEGTRTGEITPAYVSSPIDLQRAINTVQGSATTPTFYAQSGATFGTGTINLTSATPDGTVAATVTVDGGTYTADISIYANNVLIASGVEATGLGLVFPSRLLVSPEKFPETFDNPNADSAIFSNAIIDVNADDGEEITGFSSFLAIASSSDSQVQSTLIVFKNKSVYAIDVVSKSQTKLESSGQGCTIPGSIAPTANGIMFANKSGMYVVTSNLEVSYIGRWMEGYWDNDINKDSIETEAIGFTDSISRKYKLSTTPRAATTNSDVVVYDYITDEGAAGSWSLYDNIAASNWVQTSTETLFGNYGARVFKNRNADDNTDYRDDAGAITATFEYSPRSFGDSGEEVLMDSFITHIEAGESVAVSEALDMSNTYTALDTITNPETVKSFAVANSPTSPSVLFYQVKYVHNTIDKNFKLAGIDFRVAATNAKKITDAGDS